MEVFQKIGGPQTGGVSPDGPHTHVLPKLHALRPHAFGERSDPGRLGAVRRSSIHAVPVFDRMGGDKDFDEAMHSTAFQDLLKSWGVPEYLDAKEAAWAAIRAGDGPDTHVATRTRDLGTGRVAQRDPSMAPPVRANRRSSRPGRIASTAAPSPKPATEPCRLATRLPTRPVVVASACAAIDRLAEEAPWR